MYKDVFAALSDRDIKDLENYAELAGSVGGDYLEIGSLQGGSTLAILEKMPESSILFCLDIWGRVENYETFCFNIKRYNKWNNIVPIIGDFRNTYKYISNKRKLSFVFVDNDHTFFTTALPIYYFWNNLLPGGYMLFHDYKHPNYPGVEEFISLYALEVWGETISDRPGVFIMKKMKDIDENFLLDQKEKLNKRFGKDACYLDVAIKRLNNNE